MVTNTTTSFSTMLNQYLPNKLLEEELIKQDWLLANVERDDSWLGGDLIVPFVGSEASSVQYASLPGSTDIHEGSYIRGSVTDYQEIWGSMIFNEADLMQHGAISEQNLLKLLTDGAADGTIKVDRVERFSIGKKVTLVDDNTAQADYYVTAVNLNTQYITLSATRGGAAASLTAFTTAQNAKFYYVGVLESDVVTNKFTSLKSALLSSTNGGSASLYGQTKTAYPYLQDINVDGSGVTQANILEQIFL